MKNFRILLAFLLVSCTTGEPSLPYSYNTNPTYTKGYVEFFGAEYAVKGIKNNILSISLFSEGLTIDSTLSLVGTGQFLFLEDVYIAPTDTILPAATYTISSSQEAYTITPGKNDTVGTEVFPVGAYISYYEENTSRSTMKFISEGTLTVSYANGKYTIDCNLKTADKRQLKGTFSGELPHYDESLITPVSNIRRKHSFHTFQSYQF